MLAGRQKVTVADPGHLQLKWPLILILCRGSCCSVLLGPLIGLEACCSMTGTAAKATS